MDKYQRYRLKDLEAYRAKKREYAKTDDQREKRRIYMQRWRVKNRDKGNQARRDYHERNREVVNEKQKIRHLTRSYGLTALQLEQMIEEQQGCCKLCQKKPDNKIRRGLHVDHSHETGEIRALLCFSCNAILGRIEAIGIEKFTAYLNDSRK